MAAAGWLGLFAFGLAVWLAPSAMAFDCAESKCPQISSCAEAAYKLLVCGHHKRDADGDGIPCESLCGDDVEVFRQRMAAQWPDGLPKPSLSLAATAGAEPPRQPDAHFACGAKRICRQMVSCAEARFHLVTCGIRSLDGDGDGVPCNSLCRAR